MANRWSPIVAKCGWTLTMGDRNDHRFCFRPHNHRRDIVTKATITIGISHERAKNNQTHMRAYKFMALFGWIQPFKSSHIDTRTKWYVRFRPFYGCPEQGSGKKGSLLKSTVLLQGHIYHHIAWCFWIFGSILEHVCISERIHVSNGDKAKLLMATLSMHK